MLKALVCVSCIFLILLYFGEKSIVNCNLGAAGGGFSLGFHGSDLLGSHIARDKRDKRVSIVETNRSTRHTSSPRQIRAARAKCLADVGAYWTYREGTTGRKFKRCIYTAPLPWFIVHSDCHWLFFALPVVAGHERTIVITDYILEVVLPFSITGAGVSPKVCHPQLKQDPNKEKQGRASFPWGLHSLFDAAATEAKVLGV